MSYRADDINLLLPSFRSQVEKVLETLTRQGYKPVLFDGLRTKEEAARNAMRGVGIKDSMHCYGCAADLICDVHGWSCAKAKCRFFLDLGMVAEGRKLVWGGRFGRVDLPHIQGVPVAWQGRMRALGAEQASAARRDALVAEWLAR